MVTNESVVMPKPARPPFLFYIMRAMVRALFFVLFKIEMRGLNNLPHDGGYIIAANHLSWLDIFLLMTQLPPKPRIAFIAAREEVFHSPVRIYFTTKVGYVIPVDRLGGRVGRELVGSVAKVLEEGMALVIFPKAMYRM